MTCQICRRLILLCSERFGMPSCQPRFLVGVPVWITMVSRRKDEPVQYTSAVVHTHHRYLSARADASAKTDGTDAWLQKKLDYLERLVDELQMKSNMTGAHSDDGESKPRSEQLQNNGFASEGTPEVHERQELRQVKQVLSLDTAHNEMQVTAADEDALAVCLELSCSGCGSKLQCASHESPGFVNKSKCETLSDSQIQPVLCLRCEAMKKFNVALEVKVLTESYRDILRVIADNKGLVILVVDLSDFPNSLFPDLPSVIGCHCPLVVVGNKVDLLPVDSADYLHRIQAQLEQEITRHGLSSMVKRVMLISAKTGFKIEQLINLLFFLRKSTKNVYIVGSTNAGKSSLFNALLKSDYCNSQLRELWERATVSTWPGTTLGLLKFPIARTDTVELRRFERLKAVENSSRRGNKMNVKSKTRYTHAPSGHVGISVTSVDHPGSSTEVDPYTQASYALDVGAGQLQAAEEVNRSRAFNSLNWSQFEREAHWCYDTPGAVSYEQIINFLTPREVELILPKRPIIPRVFELHPGQSIFLTGLARLDFLQGQSHAYVTVFASAGLDVHITDTSQANDFVNSGSVDGSLQLPMPVAKRDPPLPRMCAQEFELKTTDLETSVADILFSSIGCTETAATGPHPCRMYDFRAGLCAFACSVHSAQCWMSVSGHEGDSLQFEASTPGGYGCRLREPSLLPYAVRLRGNLLPDSQAFATVRPVSREEFHAKRPETLREREMLTKRKRKRQEQRMKKRANRHRVEQENLAASIDGETIRSNI